MAQKRGKSSSSEAAARPAPSAMSAETIAAGTAAGALMLGVVQAEAARKDAALQTVAAAPDNEAASDGRDSGQIEAAQATMPVEEAPPPSDAAALIDAADPARSTESGGVQAIQSADDSNAGIAVTDVGASMNPAPVPGAATQMAGPTEAVAATETALPAGADAIVTRISDQITSAIERISENLGGNTGDLGQSIAADIAETAISIVRDIPVLSQSSLPGDLAQALPDAGRISEQVQDLLEPVSGLATLPADLLGAETVSDLGGGLMSDLFYSDGAAEAPPFAETIDIAAASSPGDALSDAASTMVEGLGAMPISLIGTSYADDFDLPYSGMQSSLGALHVV